MATVPAPAVNPVPPAQTAEARDQALVPSAAGLESEQLIPRHKVAARLPVEVDVSIPLRNFRVRNLLALDSGTVIASQWGHGEDVPLGSGEVQLAWSEFEVSETHLSVRLTRLV